MRKFRVSIDDEGFTVEEKGWFFWHRLCGRLKSKEQARHVINALKEQPK